MGTWGTAVPSNDDYQDIYCEIKDEFNKGAEIDDVLQKVTKKYEVEFSDDENALNNLCYAAAYAEWECGSKSKKYFEKAKQIINSGNDISCWRELNSSISDLKKRQKALDIFISKISIPKEKPIKPKTLKYKPAIYRKGQILSVRLENGKYTGAIVLEELKASDEFGINFIVKAYMTQDDKPTIDEIMNAKVFDYAWYIGANYKKYIKNIEIIGYIDIKFSYVNKGMGTLYSGWINFISEFSDKHYMFIENKDIKDMKAFLKIPPSKILVRQKKSVLSHIQR